MKRLPLFNSIDQISKFLKANKNSGLKIEIISKKNKYLCINEILWNIRFSKLSLYKKLKSLKNTKQYLKQRFNFEKLDKIAYEKSDNEFTKEINKEKNKIFKKIEDNNLKKFNKK